MSLKMPDNVVKFTGKHVAEVLIRPHVGAVECDVVTIVKGEEMTVECRDWQEAVTRARIERRTYGLAPIDFPDERPADV
jgi:hypothetical protein